jgi:hypothetical protein
MTWLLNHPITRVVMLLWCSFAAILDAIEGETFWAYTMVLCAAWWLFRVWEDLREARS